MKVPYNTIQYNTIQYILVMQRFRVVYYGISHESLVFSWYTREPLGECVYEESTSDKCNINVSEFRVYTFLPLLTVHIQSCHFLFSKLTK